MSISLIIPVLNEEKTIDNLLQYIKRHTTNLEIETIVVDGKSSDKSFEVAKKYADLVLQSEISSRAVQMNLGAKHASKDILYFVHADVIPPGSFYHDIISAVLNNFSIGLYRQKFDSKNPLLLINTFFSRFNRLWCRGGDQTLFITKSKFQEMGGFDESFSIMEEYDFLSKVWGKQKIVLFPKYTLVSARKYSNNSWLRVQWANYNAFSMFRKGESSAKIKEKYLSILNAYQNY